MITLGNGWCVNVFLLVPCLFQMSLDLDTQYPLLCLSVSLSPGISILGLLVVADLTPDELGLPKCLTVRAITIS